MSRSEKSVIQISKSLAFGLLASIIGSVFAVQLDTHALEGTLSSNVVLKFINQGKPFRVYEIQLEDEDKKFFLNKEPILQSWNEEHDNVKFHQSDTYTANFLQMGFKGFSMYLRSLGEPVTIKKGEDFFNLIRCDLDPNSPVTKFTYVVMPDGKFRFSVINLNSGSVKISKHLVLSEAADKVLYAGEFSLVKNESDFLGQLPLLKEVWNALGGGQDLLQSFEVAIKDPNHPWILAMNNDSGSYHPSFKQLDLLKNLFEANFSDLIVHTYSVVEGEEKNRKETETGIETHSEQVENL